MDDVYASRVTWRDKLRFAKALTKIPIRVSITGTRGKSSQAYMIANALTDRKLWAIAKVTGDIPFFLDRGGVHNILRKDRHPVFLDETACLWGMCKGPGSYPDAIVFENQAIQPYTMYAFHELYSKPRYIIVTNIRRDHQEFLGKTKAEIATAYGRSLSRAKRVISGDSDEEVNEILETYAGRIGAEFHPVEVPRKRRHIPGAENAYTAQAFLGLASQDFPEYGNLRMTSEEMGAHMDLIESMIELQPSPLGIEWFDGAKLNDIDSTGIVLDYLMKKHPGKKFVIVAYLRGDRPARTIAFTEYFNEVMEDRSISAIYLAGTGAEYVRDRIDVSLREKAFVVRDDTMTAAKVLRHVETDNNALVTVANAVSPFMRHVRRLLMSASQRHVIYQQSEGRQTPVAVGP